MSKLLAKSSSDFVRELFAPQPAAEGAAGGKAKKGPRKGSTLAVNTVSMQFKGQLKSLMKSITETNVQYVRCVKPNKNKSSTEFDKRMVVEQLRSAGVVEAIRMSRAAFPNRMLLDEFGPRFLLLEKVGKGKKKKARKSAKETKAMVAALVDAHAKGSKKVGAGDLNRGGDLFVFGKTKIFFVKVGGG